MNGAHSKREEGVSTPITSAFLLRSEMATVVAQCSQGSPRLIKVISEVTLVVSVPINVNYPTSTEFIPYHNPLLY